jgi:hypothetical protein
MTLLGGVAITIAIATIAYAHLSMGRDLQRTVDVLRRTANDSVAAVGTLTWMARSTDAVRGPGEDVTRRSIAAIEPGIAVLEALADMLRVVPGAAKSDVKYGDSSDLPSSLSRLRSGVDRLTADARRMRTASQTLAARMRKHEIPSMQPDLAAAGARVRELRDVLHDANPARGITLLVDLIAGLYLIFGGALIVVGRTLRRGAEAGAKRA